MEKITPAQDHREKNSFRTINNVQIYYECTGNEGDPLVLVHGSWLDHHGWDPVVPLLSESFRVLTYDRRGHSQSERPASPGTVDKDVADLAALLEELNYSPAHILGNSYGGTIGIRLAERRPDLFKSLNVHEPPLFDLLSDGSKEHAFLLTSIKDRLAAVVKLLEAGDTEAGARLFVETVAFGPGTWEQLPPELKKTIVFNTPTFLDEMRDKNFFSVDLAQLKNFPYPVFLSCGEMSPPFFLPVIEKLAANFPNAQLKIIPEASHGPEQTNPEAYVSAILRFTGKT